MPKVFNKGAKPIIYSRSFDGHQCIHPGKGLTFGEDEAKKIIKKFDNAVSEQDYEKHLADIKKKNQEAFDKAAKEQAEKDKKASGGK